MTRFMGDGIKMWLLSPVAWVKSSAKEFVIALKEMLHNNLQYWRKSNAMGY
jgi:hypothetical protein